MSDHASSCQNSAIEFAWLELTNICNLQCIHCYAESGPFDTAKDLLSQRDYVEILDQLHEIGCRQVQFIGGEPTLNRDLPNLIDHASALGFEFIEVFSNLVSVREDVWRAITQHKVALATSFYSSDKNVYAAITKSPIAFDRTVASLRRALSAGLTVRAGFIEMDENRGQYEETAAFLNAIGVENVGYDHVRAVGRADLHDEACMGELCGSCTGRVISIGPDGQVAPCNMSKRWSVGSVLERSLAALVNSPQLEKVRETIGEAVAERRSLEIDAICAPKTCGPYGSCCPSTQQCGPCAPNGCTPCYPKG